MNKLPEKWCILGGTALQNSKVWKALKTRYYGDSVDYYHFKNGICEDFFSTISPGHIEITLKQLEEIMLPKAFILPEKWYIKVTKENADIIDKWKSTTKWKNSAIYWYYVTHDGRRWGEGAIRSSDGMTEITFEQFKQFVLKEPIMKKKIIGYKVPIDLFGGNIKKDTIYKATSSHPTPQPKFCPIDDSNKPICGFYYDLPKEIVETWEPVYEEEYKVGDWVLLSNNANGWGSDVHINNQIVQIEEIKTLYDDDHILRIFFEFNGKREITIYKEIVRKAIPEEIKEAQIPDITINGYKAVFFDKYVKFGCAEIDNKVFIDLYKQLSQYPHSNRDIQFVTIGSGVFSKEIISQIANYINRK